MRLYYAALSDSLTDVERPFALLFAPATTAACAAAAAAMAAAWAAQPAGITCAAQSVGVVTSPAPSPFWRPRQRCARRSRRPRSCESAARGSAGAPRLVRRVHELVLELERMLVRCCFCCCY